MRTLLLFLACLTPLAAALWYAGRDDRRTSELPDVPVVETESVLRGSDFAGEHEKPPFPGQVRRLRDISVKVVDKGYVQLYLRVERLARADDRPRLDQVTCAVFDPPEEGRPRLRLTFHAPQVWGDPRALLDPRKDQPKIAQMGGGVVVRDAAGRTLAEIESLAVDLTGRTVRSAEPVALSLPERGLRITGVGLAADIDLRRARIEGSVSASVDVDGAKATLACAGAATAIELEEGRAVRVVFEREVRLRHPLGSVACDRAVADAVRAGDAFELEQADLSGNVRLELAEQQGLERVETPRLVIRGMDHVVCEAPVRALRRGPLRAFGLGERLLDIEAAGATILLRRTADKKVEIEEARFAGFRAVDQAGAGHIAAALVTYVADGPRLHAEGGVEARAPDGFLAAERLDMAQRGKDGYALAIHGEKRVEYVADGELGPLGKNQRGRLHFTGGGRVDVEAEGERVKVTARDGVVAYVDEGDARLEAAAVAVVVHKGAITDFAAAGPVRLRARGAVIEGDTLDFANNVARVRGRPASVVTDNQRQVTAAELAYGEDGTFRADGDVFVRTRMQDGLWTVRCGTARGVLAEGGPREVVAEGGVSARGPAGERVAGLTFRYDAGTGRAILRGSPATVRQGDDLAMEAPGFDLLLRDGEVAEAHTLGAGTLAVRSVRVPGLEGSSIDRWHVDLRGPVLFLGDRVEIPDGARLVARDRAGQEVLRASARRVDLELDRTEAGPRPRRLLGSGGVVVEDRAGDGAKVTADRLAYETGSKQVHVHGRARVEAPGWPREVRFGHVVFVVRENGIDLKRASEIEIIERPPRRDESAK